MDKLNTNISDAAELLIQDIDKSQLTLEDFSKKLKKELLKIFHPDKFLIGIAKDDPRYEELKQKAESFSSYLTDDKKMEALAKALYKNDNDDKGDETYSGNKFTGDFAKFYIQDIDNPYFHDENIKVWSQNTYTKQYQDTISYPSEFYRTNEKPFDLSNYDTIREKLFEVAMEAFKSLNLGVVMAVSKALGDIDKAVVAEKIQIRANDRETTQNAENFVRNNQPEKILNRLKKNLPDNSRYKDMVTDIEKSLETSPKTRITITQQETNITPDNKLDKVLEELGIKQNPNGLKI
jgi:hypothetical protein